MEVQGFSSSEKVKESRKHKVREVVDLSGEREERGECLFALEGDKRTPKNGGLQFFEKRKKRKKM